MKNLLFILSMSVGLLYGQDIKLKMVDMSDSLISCEKYFDNGQIHQVGYYENDEKAGEWLMYDREGNKVTRGKFKNDVKIGCWKHWDNSGSLIASVYYKEGEIVKYERYLK
jgi:antitoxin component YwqK of YwqJK toxin-antitoxin module